VDNGFFGDGAISRAAFVIEKAKHFAERVGACGVPKKRASTAYANEADLAEFFEMVRKCGRGDVEFILNFACDHTRGVRGEEQAHDLQPRLGAESRESVGGAGNEERIRLGHISIIAEIQ
jgi:hypothetical protein